MSDPSPQPGILAAPPALGRSLTFRIEPESDARAALLALRDGFAPDWGVAALGEPAVRAEGLDVPGLRVFPALAGAGISIPSTQQALWILLRGEDRGALFDVTEKVRSLVAPAFALDDAMDMFLYAGGRDLTGFEDGTENPAGDAAVDAAIVAGGAFAGSSFVAVQRWVHDLERFRAFPREKRDHTIGRELESNDEIEDAPPSAHVKRTAQESFDPPAFMVRRSMPWATAD
ncbi:MAG TPA: Dyp-type peroxidase, partial [Thermoanaerobaculia bacterium]|nr:Dyp-type peroxidase [Thermoanaerobaculia bacterium]